MEATPIWITREFGRTWMGCKHGSPGADPTNPDTPSVRVCQDCFIKVREARRTELIELRACKIRLCDVVQSAIRTAETLGHAPIVEELKKELSMAANAALDAAGKEG